VPKNYDPAVVDAVISVTSSEAVETAKTFMRTEGVLCGISGGAALCGALKYAEMSKEKTRTIVVILPDTGERYLSTALFD
jgi:cysteine synthase A